MVVRDSVAFRRTHGWSGSVPSWSGAASSWSAGLRYQSGNGLDRERALPDQAGEAHYQRGSVCDRSGSTVCGLNLRRGQQIHSNRINVVFSCAEKNERLSKIVLAKVF